MADPYFSNKLPYSVAIFETFDRLKRDSFIYGADEWDLYKSDLDAANDINGWTIYGSWQPSWTHVVNQPKHQGQAYALNDATSSTPATIVTPGASYYQDAYGDYRQVGNSDIID